MSQTTELNPDPRHVETLVASHRFRVRGPSCCRRRERQTSVAELLSGHCSGLVFEFGLDTSVV